jgi:hypothetical protein
MKFGITMSGLAATGPLAAIGMASIATGIIAIRTALLGMDIENWKVATKFFIAVAAAKGVNFSGLASEVERLTDTSFKVEEKKTLEQPKQVQLIIEKPIYLKLKDDKEFETFIEDIIDARLQELSIK